MPEEIASLQRNVSNLRKWIVLLTIGWVATVSVWLLAGIHWNVQGAESQSLRVRRLAIVDKNGIERVVISAPVPEPMINGSRGKRDEPMSGILIYDPKGNERGGYGTEFDLGGNWSAKAEYDYIDFGSRTALATDGITVLRDSGAISQVKIGVNYRFSGPAAVVARY